MREIDTDRTGALGNSDDQLYMLKLCLELQLEALLLALGSSAVDDPQPRGEQTAERSGLPWPRWLAEDIEVARALTRECVDDGVPLPPSMGLSNDTGLGAESLTARYSAMSAVLREVLEQIDPVRHPAAVKRLVQTRDRCERRLGELLGQPMTGPEVVVYDSDAGHYLG